MPPGVPALRYACAKAPNSAATAFDDELGRWPAKNGGRLAA